MNKRLDARRWQQNIPRWTPPGAAASSEKLSNVVSMEERRSDTPPAEASESEVLIPVPLDDLNSSWDEVADFARLPSEIYYASLQKGDLGLDDAQKTELASLSSIRLRLDQQRRLYEMGIGLRIPLSLWRSLSSKGLVDMAHLSPSQLLELRGIPEFDQFIVKTYIPRPRTDAGALVPIGRKSVKEHWALLGRHARLEMKVFDGKLAERLRLTTEQQLEIRSQLHTFLTQEQADRFYETGRRFTVSVEEWLQLRATGVVSVNELSDTDLGSLKSVAFFSGILEERKRAKNPYAGVDVPVRNVQCFRKHWGVTQDYARYRASATRNRDTEDAARSDMGKLLGWGHDQDREFSNSGSTYLTLPQTIALYAAKRCIEIPAEQWLQLEQSKIVSFWDLTYPDLRRLQSIDAFDDEKLRRERWFALGLAAMCGAGLVAWLLG